MPLAVLVLVLVVVPVVLLKLPQPDFQGSEAQRYSFSQLPIQKLHLDGVFSVVHVALPGVRGDNFKLRRQCLFPEIRKPVKPWIRQHESPIQFHIDGDADHVISTQVNPRCSSGEMHRNAAMSPEVNGLLDFREDFSDEEGGATDHPLLA